MKNVVPLCVLALCLSCLETGDGEAIDLAAPAIRANAGQGGIQPAYFFKTTGDMMEIPLAFTIEDESGIREIKLEAHSGFDGHTHGKSRSARNPKFKLFTYNEVMRADSFEDPTRFSMQSVIHLDDRNPGIEADELVLGGPYHFSIQATDVEGNETSYGDDTTYHTTLFLNRSYAPQVAFDGNDLLASKVFRNTEHPASSEIIFLWIYVQGPNGGSPAQEGAVVKERIWGQSNWPHQSRPNAGEMLPDTENLDFRTLFGSASDFLSGLEGNSLVVWAEDANGNISVNQFNN